MAFQIIRNDITKVKADAIVNTANPRPVIGDGTDSAIYKAAGINELLAKRMKIGDIARGEVAVTPAFNLSAKYIIHTVGPVWNGGTDEEFDILKKCYMNSLKAAASLKCKSIAFPLIATGVYNFPKDKALQIAMAAIQEFLLENEMKVILVVFDKKAFELSGNLFDDIREYVDTNYVENTYEKEYGRSLTSTLCGMQEALELYACEYNEISSDGADFAEEDLIEMDFDEEDFDEDEYSLGDGSSDGICFSKGPDFSEAIHKVSYDDLIAASDKTFQEKLFEIIDERGLTGPEVYRNYISKQVFSKIQSDKYYHPNKFTALALCLSLHLDVDQTLDLIGRAGWTLSPSSKADLIVKGCILNQEYNIVNINCILFDYDCPEFEKIK